jgi:DNA repair exonuclease SbcCD ATPase subunit
VNRLEKIRRRVDDLLQDYNHAAKTVLAEREQLSALKQKVQESREARELIQHAAQAVQVRAHEQIAKVVTRCLKTVFGGTGYEFKIHFERKRGRTEARMRFVRGRHEVEPTSAAGGGVVDLAALALRVACLLLATPRRRKLLVLDEPYRNINGQLYRERAAELIEVLAQELDLQVIIATGLDWLKIGTVIEIGNIERDEASNGP